MKKVPLYMQKRGPYSKTTISETIHKNDGFVVQ